MPENVSVLVKLASKRSPVVLSNFTPMCVDLTKLSPKTALASATVPVVDPKMFTVGAPMYPLPPFVTFILFIVPFLIYAVAVAPEPPPPTISIVGAFL